jgi:hypothetical protein
MDKDLWWDDHLREEIRKHREVYEDLAKRSVPSGRQGSLARDIAVAQAHELLVRFGQKPTRTRGKAWHLLAEILYADANADLFQTIRDYETVIIGEDEILDFDLP